MGPKSRSESAEVQDAPPWLTRLWYLTTALTIWAFGFVAVSSSDLWWHLAAGRRIWDLRALPATDSWSFTAAGRSWINHEWLADLIFDGWTRAFGLPALLYWKWGITLACYLLLFHLLRRLTRSSLASWTGVLLALALGEIFLEIRPHLYTQLGYVLVLALTLPRGRPSPWLPVVFLVWANLHGGVTFGLMALGVILAVPLLLREEAGARSWLRAAGSWGACSLAALVNPYGWSLLVYPFRYLSSSSSPYRATLREWLPLHSALAPPLRFSEIGSGLYLAAVVLLFAAGGLRRNPRLAFTGLALSALTLAMTLQSRRFVALFGISAALVAALAVEALVSLVSRRFGSGLRGRRLGLEIAPAVLALVLSLVWLLPRHPFRPVSELFPILTRTERFPAAACGFLKSQGITGNVFAAYTWGGYLPFCGANVRVYIDGRADTVYDDETYRRFVRVLNREPGWQEIVNSSGADYVLWPRERGSVIRDLLASGRWREVYGDRVAVLMARAVEPIPERPRPPPLLSSAEDAKITRLETFTSRADVCGDGSFPRGPCNSTDPLRIGFAPVLL